MKKLYEYLIDDINQSIFDYDSRFWIEAVTDLTISGDFKVSVDGNDWTSSKNYLLNAGDSIYIYTDKGPATIKYIGKFNIGGDIKGLLSRDGKTEKSLKRAFAGSEVIDASQLNMEYYEISDGCYVEMFYKCTSLTKAPKLPAMKLAEECYRGMFEGCISLKEAPELPATRIYGWCYQSMFSKCESLVKAPELPATTMYTDCYSWMFQFCKQLKTPPELPAKKLEFECYQGMFYNCKSLVITPKLPATKLVSCCYDHMFEGCRSLTNIAESGADLINNDNCKDMFKNTKFEK